MLLANARPIALQICERLRPYCDRCEIAGSVRRRKPDVGDIEIVCIPKELTECTLFGPAGKTRDSGFVEVCLTMGEVRKGDPWAGRYIQIQHRAGIQVDLFTATRHNWGLIYAIRTGSARFSHKVLARGWVRAGYHSIDGMLCTKAYKVSVREEADLFDLIGTPWVQPEART